MDPQNDFKSVKEYHKYYLKIKKLQRVRVYIRRWGTLLSDVMNLCFFEYVWKKQQAGLRSKCTAYKTTTNDKVVRFCVTPQHLGRTSRN